MASLPFDKQLELMILEIYGLPEGIRASRVLVPSILGDFRNMLKAASPGTIVKEEYKTEDYKTTIVLTGETIGSGKNLFPCVRSCRVGEKEAVLARKIAGKPGEWL